MQPINEALDLMRVDLTRRRRGEQPSSQRQTMPIVVDASFCARCQNRGYLRVNVPFGHPQFGKPVACECTKARKREAHRRSLWEQSRIDQQIAFQEDAFTTFQFRLPGVLKAYKAAVEFADTPRGWLVLQGPHGCGKTHLAVAIAKQCLDNGAAVLFANVPDLLRSLKATLSPEAEERYDDEFNKMCEAEVLILDDLGVQQGTPWVMETLYLLFNHRYIARLATVVTTNRVDLVGIDPCIRSRLRDHRLVRTVVMDAQDFREMEI